MYLLAGGVGSGKNAVERFEVFLGEHRLIVVQEVAVIGGHGVTVEHAVVGRGVDRSGVVRRDDRVGVAGHFVERIRLHKIDELVVGKDEHVRRSCGIFEIAGLTVHRADSAEFKNVFLFRVRGGKIVAELFRQLQLDLIRPHLQRNGFLFCRCFRSGLFRRGLLCRALRGFRRGAAAAGQHRNDQAYCHQQCKDLLHLFCSFIVLSQKVLAFCCVQYIYLPKIGQRKKAKAFSLRAARYSKSATHSDGAFPAV